MNGEKIQMEPREAALRGLAVVGFVALVGLGIWLAIYSARYVPRAVNSLGNAATGVTSIFNPSGNDLGGSTASTTSTSTDASETTTTVTLSAATTTTTGTARSTPATVRRPGTATYGTYTVGGTGTTTLFGLPDLETTITAVGYITGPDTSTFIASSTVPTGFNPAVKFIIKNVGTNVMHAGWIFFASLPSANFLYQSDPQQALFPGDHIDYTLGINRGDVGNQTITISANPDKLYPESNFANDTASTPILILGF